MPLALTGTINVNVLPGSGKPNEFQSMTPYSSTHFLACRPDNGNWPKYLQTVRTSDLTFTIHFDPGQISARGMHYNPVADKAVYVNGNTQNLEAVSMSTLTKETVSSTGTYNAMVGDFSNTYIFGWKTDGVHKLFRTDAYGSNEITVDTSALLGGNAALSFSDYAFDSDNQRFYFVDGQTSGILRSISSDLSPASFITHNLKLRTWQWNFLTYSSGFIYYGGTDPVTELRNGKQYRYNTTNDEVHQMVGQPEIFSDGTRPHMFIEPYTNCMILSGTSVSRFEGADFSFYTAPAMPLTLTPRALSVVVAVEAVDGATAYRLTLQKTGSSTERTVKSSFTDLNQKINNLLPDTEYTVRLFSTAGNAYGLVAESTVTTLVNSVSSYNKDDFVGDSGRFNLSDLDTASMGLMSDVFNEIFVTGEEIDIVVPGVRGIKTSKFVNRGANVTVEDSDTIVAPFSKDGGAGQSVSLTLSDASVVQVSFDETTEAITIGPTSYASGDSFVLDGKKATIVDI